MSKVSTIIRRFSYFFAATALVTSAYAESTCFKLVAKNRKWPTLTTVQASCISQDLSAQKEFNKLCRDDLVDLSDKYTIYRGYEIKRDQLREKIKASTDPNERAALRSDIIYLEQDWGTEGFRNEIDASLVRLNAVLHKCID
jgi:hypothetical protein